MGVAKVILNNETLMDVTQKTVTSSTLATGYTALGADGENVVGTLIPPAPTLETVTKSYTPTTSQQTETITPSTGYDGIGEVDVTVGAMPTMTLPNNPDPFNPSGTKKSTINYQREAVRYLNIPTGYNGTAQYYEITGVPNGTVTAPATITATGATSSASIANQTITLTKAVSVTPSVTTAGYVSSGTAGNASVSLTASDITFRESNSLIVNGKNVTAPIGYYPAQAYASVADGTAGTPTATKGSVSNHTISVTPSVTNTTGYITGSTKTGTAVTVSASELVSGSETKTENGIYNVTNLAELVVNVSSGGGGGVKKKQINFIDYDGTIVESYTKTEWQSVSSLPSNPAHTGLVAQGWNWTKAQIDAQLTAMPDGDVNVGQMYITASGDTEIDVSFPTADRLSPYLTLGVNGTVKIDWGDNTATDTLTGTSLTTRKYIQHTYASPGDYTISVHVMSGSFQPYCGSSSNSLLNSSFLSASQNTVYATRVRSVRFGSGVTSIGEYAFNLSYALSYVTLPNSITSIDNDAFYYCRSLTSITIPSGITSIGDYTFGGCGALISASCPSSVTSIGEYAFYECTALTSATIPNNATSIGEYAFNKCTALTSIAIPGNVTSIDASTFRECHVLASATIPSGITTIGTNAFNTCGMLVSLSLPNGVTSIGNQAFNACYSLMSITIPSSVTSIGNSAFKGCAGAKEIHVKPTTPPTLGSTPFDGYVADCTIYVPSASLADYQATTGWSRYASAMVGE